MRGFRKIGVVIAAGVATIAVLTPAWAATKPRHIVDAPYKISFYTPVGWGGASLTTTTAGDTKVYIVNPKDGGAVATIQVDVLSGRRLGAAQVASGISSSGATVLGSHLASFSTIHDAEQITFSESSDGVVVDGKVEAFFMNGRTYYVAVDSNSIKVMDATLSKAMNTWGS